MSNIQDDIWSVFDNYKNVKEYDNITIKNYCRECDKDIINSTCEDCGLVVSNQIDFSSYIFEEGPMKKTCKVTSGNTRIIKMQEWSRWSNDEKKEYKLNQYVSELCVKLNILQTEICSICNLVRQVMIAIKDSSDGPKRSRVKDGIIIMCIYYTLKNSDSNCVSYIDLSKVINLDIKYVSKADKLIMELINLGQLKVTDEFITNILKPEQPINHIIKIIKKYDIDINENIISQISKLVSICEDNDILFDHTPLSIGVACLYYTLDYNCIDVNIKLLSHLYKISIVTILKTFNKLKIYDIKLKESFT